MARSWAGSIARRLAACGAACLAACATAAPDGPGEVCFDEQCVEECRRRHAALVEGEPVTEAEASLLRPYLDAIGDLELVEDSLEICQGRTCQPAGDALPVGSWYPRLQVRVPARVPWWVDLEVVCDPGGAPETVGTGRRRLVPDAGGVATVEVPARFLLQPSAGPPARGGCFVLIQDGRYRAKLLKWDFTYEGDLDARFDG